MVRTVLVMLLQHNSRSWAAAVPGAPPELVAASLHCAAKPCRAVPYCAVLCWTVEPYCNVSTCLKHPALGSCRCGAITSIHNHSCHTLLLPAADAARTVAMLPVAHIYCRHGPAVACQGAVHSRCGVTHVKLGAPSHTRPVTPAAHCLQPG